MWQMLERYELKRLFRRHAGRARYGGHAGPRPRPGMPAGTDLLPQIRHIVVLMMENHSYDNYLGMLAGRGEGFPLDPDGRPEVSNRGRQGEEIRPFHLPSTSQHQDVPSQSWRATHLQWGEGKCDGFVTSAQAALAPEDDSATRNHTTQNSTTQNSTTQDSTTQDSTTQDSTTQDSTTQDSTTQDSTTRNHATRNHATQNHATQNHAAGMGYWTESDLPFYYGLARTFPLADHWFSSCLGPTFPNRRFLIAGTAHGLIDDSPYDLLDYPPAGTVFDMLDSHGISWANYHPVAAEQSRWAHYARHRRKAARRRLLSAGRLFPAVATNVEKDLKFTADIFPLGIRRYMRHVRSTGEFLTDAENGTLPAFSIVDPDFDAFSEENPQDIQKGESYAAMVINAVLHGRGWPHTLLIWVYDEHGGYYDHVPPPPAIPPDDIEGRAVIGTSTRLERLLRPLFPGLVRSKQELDAGPRRYDRYGFRVPAVIVSPYARPGYVCSQVLDHTSVLRLVEEKWNLPPLTARDAAAAMPLDALDLTSAPAFPEPPPLPEPALRWGSW